MIELPTEGDCPLHAECHGAGFECARCRLDLVRGELASLKAENERLKDIAMRAYMLTVSASASSFRRDHSQALLDLTDILRAASEE